MPKGVPLSENEREEVRRKIFETASMLFLSQGFHQTSMRQIAQSLGLGKSTLYEYFPRKDDILVYFIEQEMKEINQMVSKAAEENLGAEEKLRKIARLQSAYLSEKWEVATLIASSVPQLSPDSNKKLIALRLEYREILKRIIQQGIDDGEFQSINPDFVAAALHNMLLGYYFDWQLRSSHQHNGITADSLLDIFFNGIHSS